MIMDQNNASTSRWIAFTAAVVIAVAATGYAWAIVSYKNDVAGVKVAAVANQIALAALCLTNNGTIDKTLCDKYLSAFNHNFGHLSTGVAVNDLELSVRLFPNTTHGPLPLPATMAIVFICTLFVVSALQEGRGWFKRRREVPAAYELGDARDHRIASGSKDKATRVGIGSLDS